MNAPLQRTAWPSTSTTVVTDGGLETWLVFHRGIDLPAFAAYPMVATPEGRELFAEYFGYYAAIANSVGAAVVLEAPTWRANPEWAATLGHDLETLAQFIADSVRTVQDARDLWSSPEPFLIGGTVGPRGDGYRIDTQMSADEATDYHLFQVECMANAGVDMITALTMGYVAEAVGIVRAAQAAGVPAIVSYTVETDGRLPSGMSLQDAIEATDAATGGYPTHYMVNCAHPSHFDHVLDVDAPWVRRIGGIRANASAMSHAELDEMTELDEGDADDLAARYVALRGVLPGLQVIGGCCGTDHRHVACIAQAWKAAESS